MAINLITAPTGGAPLSTTDYNTQNVYIQSLILAMNQETLHLTEWDTLVKPKLQEDVYINHGGALFQVQDSDYAPAVLPADGRVYISVSRVLDTLTSAFTNSAAGYSWNSVYNGFYNGAGSQLLPYVLWLDTGDWYKYQLSRAGDNFDIASDIITFQNDLTCKIITPSDVQCYDALADVLIVTRTGAGAQEFYVKYPISIWIDNNTDDAGILRIYQNSGWKTVISCATVSEEYGIMLNPGYYQLLNQGSPGELLRIYCTGAYGVNNVTTDVVV